MNCFECATSTPAHAESGIAICAICGAAMCAEHATVVAHHLTRIEIINRPVAVEPPARHIYCPTCAAAVAARANPPHHPIRLHRHAR